MAECCCCERTRVRSEEELRKLTEPRAFIGMAERQCERFLTEEVRPLLEANREALNMSAEIRV